MKTTRKNFIGTLGAALALPVIGLENRKNEDWFEDIRVDRYYVLQGGQYGDTGGSGCPGYMLGQELIENMDYWKHCRYFEHNIEDIERRGLYLTPSQYFGAPYRKFNKIYLTNDWMMEFYNRHKNEVKYDWEFRYSKYLDDVNSGIYPPENNY